MKRRELVLCGIGIAAAVAIGFVTGGEKAPRTAGAAPGGSSPGEIERSRGSARRPAKLTRAMRAPIAHPRSRAELQAALMGGDSYRKMFEREPRDELWATAVERQLGDRVEYYQSVMLPFAENTRFECHATSCQVDMTVPRERFQEAFVLLQGLPIGEAVAPTADDVEDHPDQLHLALTTVYADGELDDTQIRRRFEQELTARFTNDLAANRAYLDQHPEALAGPSPDARPSP